MGALTGSFWSAARKPASLSRARPLAVRDDAPVARRTQGGEGRPIIRFRETQFPGADAGFAAIREIREGYCIHALFQEETDRIKRQNSLAAVLLLDISVTYLHALFVTAS